MERPQSYFAKRLEAAPELRARCEAVVTQLRAEAREDLKAIERSTLLTGEDFKTVINARAPQFQLF